MGSVSCFGSALALAVLVVACGGKDPTGAPSADEDERGSIGVPPGAAGYCIGLGYTLVDGNCTFPDGTSCEQWAFYRGACGQPHSYCNQHGGSVSSETEDAGTFTAIRAICERNGKRCEDASFMQTGKCE